MALDMLLFDTKCNYPKDKIQRENMTSKCLAWERVQGTGDTPALLVRMHSLFGYQYGIFSEN